MNQTTRQNIDLDRLKEAIPITELAERLGLEIRGRQARCYNSQAHSHEDKNKSLGLDTKRNRYKCFACGVNGSIIDLYKGVKGAETGEAIKELAGMAGLAPDSPQRHATSRLAPKSEPKATPEPTEAYSDIYEELVYLCGGLDKESLDYLTGDNRGLTEQTASDFLLCNIGDYQDIDKKLKAKFSLDELQRAGVVSDKGSLIFYKHKIIIPFMSEGRVVFLQGRRTDEGQPKYLHIKRPVPLL
jgi:DNA primase